MNDSAICIICQSNIKIQINESYTTYFIHNVKCNTCQTSYLISHFQEDWILQYFSIHYLNFILRTYPSGKTHLLDQNLNLITNFPDYWIIDNNLNTLYNKIKNIIPFS